MGTRGFEIVRFRGRYYIRYHQFDSYYEGLGAQIIARIPANPEEYREWLESMRAEYAARENALESHVYQIRIGSEPNYSQFKEYQTLPSEFPQMGIGAEFIEYFYIINLDHEVLTMNHTIHWKLGDIPREDDLWLRAIVESTYPYTHTISLDVCPEKHMASPALEIPERNRSIKYEHRLVTPRIGLAEAQKTFLTHISVTTLVHYKNEIINFGLEWSPDSFPFRELAFALVSLASGQTNFYSFPSRPCNPRTCQMWSCNRNHLYKSAGWLDEKWVGDSAPLLEFGSLSHRPGEPPGASPMETIYWFEGVLVSLALVTDGDAITKAVTWGIEKGHTNFQIVVLSLFEAAFAEVSIGNDGQPFVKASDAVHLSPLRADYCVSMHPRMRPELKPGMKTKPQHGELTIRSNRTMTRERLQSQFPGLAALVNFFGVAATRRAASKSTGVLPTELYGQIMDHVDYDTWKTCLLVSTAFRSFGLHKYRIDERTRIVAGPFVRLRNYGRERVMSFDFENMPTGEILPMTRVLRNRWTEEYNWMPVIGSDRKALMLDIPINFEWAGDVPVEPDSDDEYA